VQVPRLVVDEDGQHRLRARPWSRAPGPRRADQAQPPCAAPWPAP
jgi:hypothetical protein